MAISEFTVTSANTNQWASLPSSTTVVGGSTKYGIYVTQAGHPIFTFLNSYFYPNTTSGSTVIVELYANSEGGSSAEDPNDGTVWDGVALTNVGSSSIPTGSLSSNTAVYGASTNTKLANYVYNFTNNGYANTKKMAIGGNKNRRVFAIRSWGKLDAAYNKPYIAFIGDSGGLKYNGASAKYSVGCAGATKTSTADTWVSHTAGDGTKYYSITNTTNGLNKYVSITLYEGHTYKFTLHAHSEANYDGVAICTVTNTLLFSELTKDQLLSGSTSKCSGKDLTRTFNYTVGPTAGNKMVYIYFKSNSSNLGIDVGDTQHTVYDNISFADVMVEDLGDPRATQTAPTAANVTVEYEETATASVSGGGGQGTLQYRYRVMSNPSAGEWGPWRQWSTTVPRRTAIGTTQYQARYRGNTHYQVSPVSNIATLTVTPKKITKPTAVTGLVYNGNMQDGVNAPRYANEPASPSSLIVEVSGITSEKNAGNYSATYTIKNNNYCWVDMTTAPITVNWSIAQRVVTLTWGITSWLYDGTTHSTTCTVSNLVGNDSCTVTLSGNSITDVGTIYVTATALSNSNYRLPGPHQDKTAKLTVHPCMYIKAGDKWVPVIVIYKKVNGSWVVQTTEATIRSLFSEEGRYLGLYNDGSGWKNLIDG